MDGRELRLDGATLELVCSPYALLREGYARRDAAPAASAYTVDAEARYHAAVPGAVEVNRGGRISSRVCRTRERPLTGRVG